MLVYCTDESAIRNVSFKNITFELVDSKLNEIAGGNIDLRGARGAQNALFARDIPAFWAERVDGLTIDDFKLTWTGARMPFLTDGIAIDDFKNLRIDHFEGTGAPNNPAAYPVRLTNGEGFQTDLPRDKIVQTNVK